MKASKVLLLVQPFAVQLTGLLLDVKAEIGTLLEGDSAGFFGIQRRREVNRHHVPLRHFIPPPFVPIVCGVFLFRGSQGADFGPASSDPVHGKLQGGGGSRRGARREGKAGKNRTQHME